MLYVCGQPVDESGQSGAGSVDEKIERQLLVKLALNWWFSCK